MANVDTLPMLYRPLMDGCSVILNHCAVCGATWPLNQHHIVKRSQGNLYRSGIKRPKPTVTLCGSGNTSGCHGLAHQNRLHFRWVTTEAWDEIGFGNSKYRERSGGHWEYLLTDEPTKYQQALKMDGWKELY